MIHCKNIIYININLEQHLVLHKCVMETTIFDLWNIDAKYLIHQNWIYLFIRSLRFNHTSNAYATCIFANTHTHTHTKIASKKEYGSVVYSGKIWTTFTFVGIMHIEISRRWYKLVLVRKQNSWSLWPRLFFQNIRH